MATHKRKRNKNNTRGNRATQERTEQHKDREHCEEDGGQHKTGGQHTPHHPRHSTGPQGKQKGDTTHKTGRSATQPPFTHHATHHPLCHPTIHDGTPPSTTRGERTEETPPHEHRRQTHTHTTPQHLASNSTRHDNSTRQHCNGMSRARPAPLHWAGQQQHTPPPFHTPRRMDTVHSSTHLLSHCSRSHNR